ncbi:MAG: toxin-antitoxin system YwqK family antitoxin [Helicobacteraceae bacterium]|jgi:antitoxin component YwqK of YwqJK toxin-antitoxin module|nr:toxin-antitoxin system YwqK family antitoxin [Helicobacteraceae bacterium]
MKKVLIAILLTAMCQCANVDYKIYVRDGTARLENGKCVDMRGNLLSGKAEIRFWKDGVTYGFFCVDGEANIDRYRAYYKSGALMVESAPKGVNASENRGYYEGGALKYIIPYTNDKAEGIEKYFYESGKLKEEIPFENGKREGIAKSFYESGKLKRETPFKDDKAEGVGKGFYESGKLEEEIPFKNGVKDGIAKRYYKDGELEQESTWKNGAQEGETNTFGINGKILAIVTYKNNKAISGICHKTNGEKRPFTEAELKDWNRELEVLRVLVIAACDQ